MEKSKIIYAGLAVIVFVGLVYSTIPQPGLKREKVDDWKYESGEGIKSRVSQLSKGLLSPQYSSFAYNSISEHRGEA
jgi:hypothetical protein